MRFSRNLLPAISFRHSICPQCVGYPSMWMKSSFATFRCRSSLLSSLKAVLIAAHSLWIHPRSSACVLQARTLRISSRSRIDMCLWVSYARRWARVEAQWDATRLC